MVFFWFMVMAQVLVELVVVMVTIVDMMMVVDVLLMVVKEGEVIITMVIN